MSTHEPEPGSIPATAIDDAKLGLALSGGGHRADFFHIGVLAKLAEHGLLRRVEVISTATHLDKPRRPGLASRRGRRLSKRGAQ